MEFVLNALELAAALLAVAAITMAISAVIAAGKPTPAPPRPWWDLDEQQPAFDQAHSEYVSALRRAQHETRNQVRRQPVRDELLRVIGSADDAVRLHRSRAVFDAVHGARGVRQAPLVVSISTPRDVA